MMDEVKEALRQSYTGESKAALRLKVFAEKAESEGYAEIAKLFRVIAFSEEIHGSRCLRSLREIKSTEENLAESFESETRVAGVAYDEFIKLANREGDETTAMILSQNRDVEETHAKLYKEAMANMMEERETDYHVCKVCGFVSDGVLPDECPVCGAGKEQFVEF